MGTAAAMVPLQFHPASPTSHGARLPRPALKLPLIGRSLALLAAAAALQRIAAFGMRLASRLGQIISLQSSCTSCRLVQPAGLHVALPGAACRCPGAAASGSLPTPCHCGQLPPIHSPPHTATHPPTHTHTHTRTALSLPPCHLPHRPQPALHLYWPSRSAVPPAVRDPDGGRHEGGAARPEALPGHRCQAPYRRPGRAQLPKGKLRKRAAHAGSHNLSAAAAPVRRRACCSGTGEGSGSGGGRSEAALAGQLGRVCGVSEGRCCPAAGRPTMLRPGCGSGLACLPAVGGVAHDTARVPPPGGAGAAGC